MSSVVKQLAVLVLIVLVGALVVGSLARDDRPEVVTLQGGSASTAPTADPAIDRDDRQLSPEQERRASAAALRVTEGGTVAELDRSDDPGEAYEVEVIKNGREYDVALDAEFRPVPNRRYDD